MVNGWTAGSPRKRTPGHDWCVVELATQGNIFGFDIDTNFFLGNHPPFASIEGTLLAPETTVSEWDIADIIWKEILPKSALDAGSQNFFDCVDTNIYSHLRLHIYPDGGVARLKVYGEVHKDWELLKDEDDIDLAAAINGGKAIACNDMFFSDMSNLLMPGRGINMGDGWETKRNRTPNNRDWVIIKLATPGYIDRIVVDTHHFKGNYPDSCSIEGCFSNDDNAVVNNNVAWSLILPQQKLTENHAHDYDKELIDQSKFSHVRLNIFPDGGVSRLRVLGRIKD